MAHQEQLHFFERLSKSHEQHFNEAKRILEVGSQDINGTVRCYFPNASEYLGLDLGLAKCVDWVIPGELVELPDGWAEVTISTECFEHCQDWPKVLLNMIRITKPGGLVLVTCAGIGRVVHGTIDSDEESSPFTTDYYKNLSASNILSEVSINNYFDLHSFEMNSLSHDLYFWGIRSTNGIKQKDDYWEDPVARLARAQGQLAQAAARHAALQASLKLVELNATILREERDSVIRELTVLQHSKSWRFINIFRQKAGTLLHLFRGAS